MADAWTLELGTDVVLLRPTGVPVSGLPQKALAALAVIGLLSPEPVSRRRMGDILWPSSSPEQRLMSLRQTLASLRKHLDGDPFLIANRTSLSLKQDRVRIVSLETGALLTRFTEPWFVLMRSSGSAARQVALQGGSTVEEGEAVRSLINLLRWTVQHQADNAFGLIYHALDLATSIPGPVALPIAEDLLRRSAPNHPMRGWGSFLRALSLFYTNETSAALDEFHQIRLAAGSQGNGELMVLAAFHEAGAILQLGKLDAAHDILFRCRSLKINRARPRAAIRLEHGLGLVDACRGNYGQAFSRLGRAADMAQARGEIYELAYVSVNCAWLAASVGHDEIGKKELARFEKADTGASYRFSFTGQLARIHLHCSENDPASGVALGETALSRAVALQTLAFESYFREALARCYILLGDQSRADAEIQTAAECRKKSGWVELPWDTERIRFALAGRKP